MSEQIDAAWRLLPEYLSAHVVLSACALGAGIVIALPLAVLAARRPAFAWPLLSFASLVQTIPGLALLALFYPLLLAVSSLSGRWFGVTFPALGFLPALLALTLYALLPILRNGVTGLTGVDRAAVEAAKGVGMTPLQSLLRVEAPLAAPVVMAGVRTAAVWTIGAATLATPIGQTSLGNYIFSGLQTENWVFVLFGCAASAGLAFFVDQALGLVESGAALRSPRRIFAGLIVLVLGTALAFAGAARPDGASYVIGAKNFSEQYILADLFADRLEAEGASVRQKQGLGSAIAWRALVNNEIDVYVDYSGTLWANVMGRTDVPSRDAMLGELTRWMKEKHGVTVLGSLGFENAYAMLMRRARARELGIASLDDLAGKAGNLVLGADIEFLDRPEWAALRQAYGLAFRDRRSFNPTFMYRALSGGEVDVISGFSSDGRIIADDLLALEDPRHAIPSYDAVILIAPKRADDPMLQRALKPLIGVIGVDLMREANLSVDRDQNKSTPRAAARALAARLPASPAH
ncbi:MAG: substrate-binding region of ABC-type glycine betaine transport system [Hyphomicrobiales bacterium]|nr:substrate-binding region of ABC-type glycine betaine transport system [Hyphomicrobiales bacterium]